MVWEMDRSRPSTPIPVASHLYNPLSSLVTFFSDNTSTFFSLVVVRFDVGPPPPRLTDPGCIHVTR
jgi:hypothetical protein